jgi:hypothetical protein
MGLWETLDFPVFLLSIVSPVSSASTPYNEFRGLMDRKWTGSKPESNPVQETLRPTHLSMRRELNCNRGSPKIPKRASPKFMIPSKMGLSCSVFTSRFQQYAPQDRSEKFRYPVVGLHAGQFRGGAQGSVRCIPCPSPRARLSAASLVLGPHSVARNLLLYAWSIRLHRLLNSARMGRKHLAEGLEKNG